MEAQAVSPIPRLAYSIAESEALSGLSRSSLYRLIAAGKLRGSKGHRAYQDLRLGTFNSVQLSP